MPPRPLLLATRARVARLLQLRARVQLRLMPIVPGGNTLRAAAALQRLALRCDSLLACEELLPAPGQGALMLEARADDDLALEAAA